MADHLTKSLNSFEHFFFLFITIYIANDLNHNKTFGHQTDDFSAHERRAGKSDFLSILMHL